MMISSNGNIFRVTGTLWGEPTGHRWIPLPYAGDAELWLMFSLISLQWRHDELDGVSSRQPRDCLLNRLFRHRSKKTSKLRVTSLCEGNSPVTGGFLAQRASNAENGYASNRDARDLRRHRSHYDVTVMIWRHLMSYIVCWICWQTMMYIWREHNVFVNRC